MILQLRILKGLRPHFSQLRIAKGLRTWTSARALHYKVAVSPDQKQDYPAPVPSPLRVLRVFCDERVNRSLVATHVHERVFSLL